MRWRKIMDGVYEGERFKPEPLPVGEFKWHPDGNDRDRMNARLRACVPNAERMSIYNYRFPVTFPVGRDQLWHPDGTINGSTHVLLLICCDDPALGTLFDRPGGSIFKGKPWTPYLFTKDAIHAGPPGPWSCMRTMYRQFLKLDEKNLLTTGD